MWKKWWTPSRNDLLLNLLNEWWPLRMLYSLLERRAWTLRARTASISRIPQYLSINHRLHFIFSLSPDFDMSSSSMAFSVQASSLLSTPKRLITYSLSRGVPNPVALSSHVTYSTSLCFNPTMFLLLRSLHKTFQIQLFCFWRSVMLRRAFQMYLVLLATICHAPHGDSDLSYSSPDVLYVAPGVSSLRSDFSHCTVLWNRSFWYPGCSRCFSSAASERLWKRLPFSPFFFLNTQNNPISDRRSRLCLSCTSDLTSEARIRVTYLSTPSSWLNSIYLPNSRHTCISMFLPFCMKCMTFLTYYPLET